LYRLLGMPKGQGNQVRAVPPEGQPYLMSLVNVPDGPGLDPVTVDVRMKRGVWITGRATDKVTGKPVPSWIQYAVFEDNPFRKEAPGLTFEHNLQTGPEGTFRFVGLPGRGAVAAQAHVGRYLTGVGADRVKGLAPPFGLLSNFHTAVEVKPAGNAETVRCDVVLDPGRAVTVTGLGPGGAPPAGARASGLARPGEWEYVPAKTAELTVSALRPGESRLVEFSHAEKKLAGSLVVRGDEKGPLTV